MTESVTVEQDSKGPWTSSYISHRHDSHCGMGASYKKAEYQVQQRWTSDRSMIVIACNTGGKQRTQGCRENISSHSIRKIPWKNGSRRILLNTIIFEHPVQRNQDMSHISPRKTSPCINSRILALNSNHCLWRLGINDLSVVWWDLNSQGCDRCHLHSDCRSAGKTHRSPRSLTYPSWRPSCTSCTRTPSQLFSLTYDLPPLHDIRRNQTIACSMEPVSKLEHWIYVCWNWENECRIEMDGRRYATDHITMNKQKSLR